MGDYDKEQDASQSEDNDIAEAQEEARTSEDRVAVRANDGDRDYLRRGTR